MFVTCESVAIAHISNRSFFLLCIKIRQVIKNGTELIRRPLYLSSIYKRFIILSVKLIFYVDKDLANVYFVFLTNILSLNTGLLGRKFKTVRHDVRQDCIFTILTSSTCHRS